jgi:hypothetical protein
VVADGSGSNTSVIGAIVQLPFSGDEFFDVFVRYNLALWPALMALWMATAALVLSLWNGRISQSATSRLLAFHWAWSGVAYHAAFFTRLNPAAWLFAIVFILQAWLFLREPSPQALPTKRVTASGIVGPMLIIYALAYPALNWMQGYTFPRIATFGVPCSTMILTAGLLAHAVNAFPGRSRRSQSDGRSSRGQQHGSLLYVRTGCYRLQDSR